jgi:hypothetical protein
MTESNSRMRFDENDELSQIKSEGVDSRICDARIT